MDVARLFSRSARPAYIQLRGMAVGSGTGVDAGVPPKARAVSKANLEESEKWQKARVKEMTADRPLWKEPDPTRTVQSNHLESDQAWFNVTSNARSTAGLGSEFQADEEYRTNDKQPPASKGPVITDSPPQLKPIPETVVEKVKGFVKESISTLTHGVNNAGQPEIQDKLKQS